MTPASCFRAAFSRVRLRTSRGWDDTRWLSIPILMIVALQFLQAQTRTVKTFDASCRSCHQTIFDNYVSTPMAQASGVAADRVKAGTYQSKSYGVQYSISSVQGQVFLWYQQQTPPVSGSRALDYFLGSGHLGTTYLYLQNGYLLESPVAYYAATGGLDMKPAIPSGPQLSAALPVRPACLRCHMSGVQRSDAGTFNHYQGMPFLHSGISCEACHGSTDKHVATRGKGPLINPAKLDEARRDSICISCHLEGDVSVERNHQSALDYRPGELISDYLTFYVLAGKGADKRGVSEVEQFGLSTCKKSSGARMSCTSCHDPHFSPDPVKRVTFYRNKCLVCHNSSGFANAHHPENPDCTSCHMPRTGAENIPHVAWTDHRILRLPANTSPRIAAGLSDELLPIYSPTASPRDLAVAYYNASFNGRPQLQAQSYAWLIAHEDEIQNDPEALDALGTMSAGKGDFPAARRCFQQAVILNSKDFTATTNLGTLFAQSGDLNRAVFYWQPAFERNQDIPGLANNLALAQCKLDQVAAARATLQTVLSYSPGLSRAALALAALPACTTTAR